MPQSPGGTVCECCRKIVMAEDLVHLDDLSFLATPYVTCVNAQLREFYNTVKKYNIDDMISIVELRLERDAC